jgi:hypothetical protein
VVQQEFENRDGCCDKGDQERICQTPSRRQTPAPGSEIGSNGYDQRQNPSGNHAWSRDPQDLDVGD